jgi:hypothetical protein
MLDDWQHVCQVLVSAFHTNRVTDTVKKGRFSALPTPFELEGPKRRRSVTQAKPQHFPVCPLQGAALWLFAVQGTDDHRSFIQKTALFTSTMQSYHLDPAHLDPLRFLYV